MPKARASTVLEQVRIGMMLAEDAGYSPRLGGLLFYQGESDALNEELASEYELRFEVLAALAVSKTTS